MLILMQIILLIGFLLLFMFVFHLYVRFLSKLTQKSIMKRIEKGKINDKQLMKFYEMSDKARNRKFTAFLLYGIFYKSYIRLHDDTYQLYKKEMENRGLLQKSNQEPINYKTARIVD